MSKRLRELPKGEEWFYCHYNQDSGEMEELRREFGLSEEITGLQGEPLDGEYGQVWVCYDLRPWDRSSNWECVQ